MRVIQGMSRTFSVALLLLTGSALAAQNEAHGVRNIVLVHGAWADGSGWKGVYDILVKDGYHVSMVQEPETSFQEDVAATKRILALQDGPCILLAHSYGGSVITEAGTDRLLVWCTSPHTCQMPERANLAMESASRVTSASPQRSRRRRTVSITLTPRSFVNTSQPTCLPSKPLSWRIRRC
jgi:pimeloyl-ACP methyl ester carboxylesterase